MGIDLGDRPIRFVHYGDEKAAQLRGKAFFQMVRAFYIGSKVEPGMISSDEVMFIMMPSSIGVARIVKAHPGLVIVDVDADVLKIGDLRNIPTGKFKDDPPRISGLRKWTKEESPKWLRDCIENAGVVTTPHPWLHGPLKKINDRTMLLPNYDSDNPLVFLHDFTQVVLSALEGA